jgi:hypothetical protein
MNSSPFFPRIANTDDRLAMWLKLQQYVKENNYVQYEKNKI